MGEGMDTCIHMGVVVIYIVSTQSLPNGHGAVASPMVMNDPLLGLLKMCQVY